MLTIFLYLSEAYLVKILKAAKFDYSVLNKQLLKQGVADPNRGFALNLNYFIL